MAKKKARKKATKKKAKPRKKQKLPLTDLTPKKKARFIEEYRERGNVLLSAKAACVGRALVYYWLSADPKFQDDFNEAREEATDTLEEEARRRAVDGVETPFNTKDETIYLQKYSDTLLIFLLKANRPAKFRENQQGAPVSVTVGGADQSIDRRQGLDLSCLSDEELSALEVITKKVRKASAIGVTPASSRSPR